MNNKTSVSMEIPLKTIIERGILWTFFSIIILLVILYVGIILVSLLKLNLRLYIPLPHPLEILITMLFGGIKILYTLLVTIIINIFVIGGVVAFGEYSVKIKKLNQSSFNMLVSLLITTIILSLWLAFIFSPPSYISHELNKIESFPGAKTIILPGNRFAYKGGMVLVGGTVNAFGHKLFIIKERVNESELIEFYYENLEKLGWCCFTSPPSRLHTYSDIIAYEYGIIDRPDIDISPHEPQPPNEGVYYYNLHASKKVEKDKTLRLGLTIEIIDKPNIFAVVYLRI